MKDDIDFLAARRHRWSPPTLTVIVAADIVRPLFDASQLTFLRSCHRVNKSFF
jgi:hypothetical protein